MDPNRTLWELVWAIYEGDSDTAVELTESLKEWINKGGFLPTNVTQQAQLVRPEKMTFTIEKD